MAKSAISDLKGYRIVESGFMPNSGKLGWRVGSAIYVSKVMYSLLLTDTDKMCQSMQVVDAPADWDAPKNAKLPYFKLFDPK